MSEQQHTPEPWHVVDTEPWGIMSGDRRVAEVRAEGDARRLVVCVNACGGVPDEALRTVTGEMPGMLAYASLGPVRGLCSWCGLELYGEADPPARIRAHLAE